MFLKLFCRREAANFFFALFLVFWRREAAPIFLSFIFSFLAPRGWQKLTSTIQVWGGLGSVDKSWHRGGSIIWFLVNVICESSLSGGGASPIVYHKRSLLLWMARPDGMPPAIYFTEDTVTSLEASREKIPISTNSEGFESFFWN